MACRLPGADNLESFWDLVASGGSGICEMPADRMNRRLYLTGEKGQQSKTYSSISGLIPPRPNDPSSDFRSIDLDQLNWDPCHEILCGVVDEARSHASWPVEQLSNSRTGVYVGHCSGSALGGELVIGSMIPEVADALGDIPDLRGIPETERGEILSDLVARVQHQRPVRKDGQPKLDANLAAQLIARRFHLDGPQMVVDAACASSLIALALASASLTRGEIDVAVVSSASYSKTDSLILFSQAQSCSATASRPFDADADGLVNAEGYVVLIIKTLARARADGDKIQGIIQGIGVSSDGRGRSLWAPRKEGQLLAVQRAYGGPVSKDSVQYVEAHATSTQVGDATELEALAAFFHDPSNERKIPLGSVKSNIGHTLESAGLASLVKIVLSMQRGYIPPTINLNNLNPAIDWTTHPFTPVKTLTPWPDVEHQSRRAAINSFGIGGLNAHVIVDGPPVQSGVATNEIRHQISTDHSHRGRQNTSHLSDDDGAIAIIGRGLIIPGASDLNSFQRLLQSGESQLIPPPRERWRDTPFSETRPVIRHAFEHAKGGYIRGYKYDWRKHHIPPLQIEHANPLQFMLLDATQQALDESGYAARPFDKSRAAVVVGTLFGGDFSHQLQVGLRLPEILYELANALRSRHWGEIRIQKCCDAAEARILKSYPAIKDQTGSFTCSTQASRVAKTLNVMGGAMAIDAGDCSSLAALQSAQHLLGTGVADFVFCAAAQRDLDAAAFEAWNHRQFQTNQSNTGNDPLFPGEGVVALFLRRLTDAIANNDKIYGVIREVRAKKKQGRIVESSEASPALAGGKPASDLNICSPMTSQLTRQFGHLQGASGLLEIVGLTVEKNVPLDESKKTIVLTTTEMCEFHAVFETPGRLQNTTIQSTTMKSNGRSNQETAPRYAMTEPFKQNPSASRNSLASAEQTPVPQLRGNTVRANSDELDAKIIRLWGVDESELRQRLEALDNRWDVVIGDFAASSFPERAPYRLAIVTTEKDFQAKLQLARELLDRNKTAARVQDHGIYFNVHQTSEKPQLAAMFPGQGSQRSGMISDVIEISDLATTMLGRADRSLTNFGLPPCSDWISGDELWAENDLRSTQIAMLTADVCAYQVVREWGLRPDILIGHSFGEYAALVSAGAMEFESAIAITLARANAVSECDHSRGSMLSIAATIKDIRPLVADRSDVFISHANAPRQTVVAGTAQGVTKLAESVKSLGIPAVQVPVGSPFHTPLLEGAQAALKTALSQHRWRPPKVPVLSSVSGRFVADRDEIINNLTCQLTQPLNWVANIERLLAEDVRVFLEVGPGRVLSKLTQQIIGDRNAFTISMDDPSISVKERQLRIQACLEAIGIPTISTPLPVERKVTSIRNESTTRSQSLLPQTLRKEETIAQAIGGLPQIAAIPAESSTVIRANAGEPDTSNEEPLSKFLIDVIVEQTGYPREVIEFDWDLEADLGIDSIRKAMILGELREFFDLPPDLDRNVLNELRTLRDILALLKRSSGKSDWLQAAEARSRSSAQIDEEAVIKSQSSVEFNVSTLEDTSSQLNGKENQTELQFEDFLIDFVVERTGYPRDVIELDADLESDLGIDSIAKAQLIGEVRDHFHIPIDEAATRAVLADMRTLRHVHQMIEKAARTISAHSVPASFQKYRINGNGHTETAEHHNVTHEAPEENGFSSAFNGSKSAFSDAVNTQDSDQVSAFNRGQYWGRRHKIALQNRLFDYADRAGVASTPSVDASQAVSSNDINLVEKAELHGIAVGADVHPQNLFSIRNHLRSPLDDANPFIDSYQPAINSAGSNGFSGTSHDENSPEEQSLFTQRFRLEMSPAEHRKWSGEKPEFAGGAIVIGHNRECEELVRRLESFGIQVSWLRELGTQKKAVGALDEIWKSAPSPHLFILSPRDSDAMSTLDESKWKKRRETGITSLYWFCQKWLELVEQSHLFDDASLIGLTALGGDFGVANGIVSAESGALAGLLKAIVIESWVNGHRTMPVKLLDLPSNSSPSVTSDAICVELTEPSYDVEIGWNGDLRSVLRSIPAPIVTKSPTTLVPAGNWIVTGGARGITAYVVKQISARFPNVHFHLVGTAPHPSLTEEQRRLAENDPNSLRADAMQLAKTKKQSPLKAWQTLEKEIEIDRSLAEFKKADVQATYHSCDVADRAQLSAILESIRQQSGPITGVIHGAGIGKDASFHKKDPEMVERCLSAKLDGALNLMSLTQSDSLQAFIAFGSISGRFGANGHTDYSLANDMLAKLVGWHRQLRPTIPSTVFHWHAWDDIGMATKPETRLALEMIGMKLMPAKEGAQHFIREIDAGLPLSEVLITDTRYYRMFYPADRMLAQPILSSDGTTEVSNWPLVRSTSSQGDAVVSEATLHPITDPFLREHRLRDRPLLPMVIMTELLAESAAVAKDGRRPTGMRDLEIVTSLKFPADVPCDVQVISRPSGANSSATELRADFHSRNGKLVSASRLYAKAIVEFEASSNDPVLNEKLDRAAVQRLDWRRAQYPSVGSIFYSGGPLQCLRKYALDLEHKCIWGRISAPSLSELAGPQRDVSMWLTPSAVLDAALFTSGILAWSIRPGVTLPQGAKRLSFPRCPRPAEVCFVRSRLVSSGPTQASFEITIWGSDDRPLLVVQDYIAAWLPE
jgi:acyl transferase domain-containing protein/NAD(P)-dependent dehydrogenase (short-subunit alcohol dehydrogenase family)